MAPALEDCVKAKLLSETDILWYARVHTNFGVSHGKFEMTVECPHGGVWGVLGRSPGAQKRALG